MTFRDSESSYETPFLDRQVLEFEPESASPAQAAEAGVIGEDNRIRITRTTAVPWRWICRVALLDNQGRFHSGGTGLLISERHVLTAAHIVHPEFTDPYNYSVTVTPALNGAAEPFGDLAVSAKPRLPAGYDPQAEDAMDRDFALLTLKHRVGGETFRVLSDQALCHWGHPQCGGGTVLTVPDARLLNGKSAFTAGYPRSHSGNQLWCAAGMLHSADAQRRTMYFTADTTQGQSGSPVWVKRDQYYCLVGIAVGAGKQSNRVVRLTREMVDQLRNWIQADGDVPALQEREAEFEPEVRLDESEASLQYDTPVGVKFHSGEILPFASGPEKAGEEFYDPAASGNPLLATGAAQRRKKLSANFTVAELAHAGSVAFDRARLDPVLVLWLQVVHDFVRGPIEVVEGYYSYKYLADLAKKQGLKTVPASPHLSGKGAKIRSSGLNTLELAKAVIFAGSEDTTVGVGDSTVSMYVRQADAAPFAYISDGERRDRSLKTLREYYELFYKLPVDFLEPLRKPNLDGGKLLVHWAVHERHVRDKNTLTEVVFYKSGYVRKSRELEGLSGRYNPAKATDRKLRQQVLEICVEPVLKELVGPAQERGGVPTSPKGERVSVPAKPDGMGFDVTGRYEMYYQVHKELLGMTMSVNQAGRHVELVFSPVLAPSVTLTKHREFFRLNGDPMDARTFKLFAMRRPDLTFRLLVDGSRLHLISPGDKPTTATFSRITDAPFLTEAALQAFDDPDGIAKLQEWTPLLTSQLKHLKAFFGNEALINKHLTDFYTAKGDFLNKWDEQAQGEAGRRFNDAMLKHLRDARLGFHETDLPLARFYIRYYLSVARWRPKTNYPYLSQLDWIYRMMAILQELDRTEPARAWSISNFSDVTKYTGADGSKSLDGHVHAYKVTLNITGGALIGGGFWGEITIEKTDDRKWSGMSSVTFSIWMIAFGVSWTVKRGGKDSGLGPVKGQKLEGTGTSYIEWIPHDFPGAVEFFFGEISGSAGVKGTAKGWFMHIHGHLGLPMLPVISEEAKLGAGGIGVSGALLGAKGKIRDKSLPVTGYPIIPQEMNYAKDYKLTGSPHFGFNSAVLTEEARQAVRAMCANELPALASSQSRVRVIGNTDAVGTDARNLALSKLRADNTVQAIKDILGPKLAAGLTLVYRGEAEAKALGEERRNLDRRRVDIELNGHMVLSLKAQ